MDLHTLIQDAKPSRSSTTVKAYVQLLDKHFGPDYINLQSYDFVCDYLDSIEKVTTKKNILTSVIVYINSMKRLYPKMDIYKTLSTKYNDLLKQLTISYTNSLKQQTMTNTQKENWIAYDELIELVNKLNTEYKPLYKLSSLSTKQFDQLQQLLILKLYITFSFRNNFANMKIITSGEFKNADKKANYYIRPNKFFIGSYKTVKTHGPKLYTIPKSLNWLIKQWLKHNTSGYLLVNYDKVTPMSSNGITKFLNKIFKKHYNKKISSSMLRHIIISHYSKDKQSINEIEQENKEIIDRFHHSKYMNNLYRKI